MATCLHDWLVVELPCVQADMSLLLIVLIKFYPSCSSSIFSQATPYFTFQFPPLCKRWALTYFRLFFLRWGRRWNNQRERRERREKQSRKRNNWADTFFTASDHFQSIGKIDLSFKSLFLLSSWWSERIQNFIYLFYFSLMETVMILYRPDGPNYVDKTHNSHD